MSKTMKLKIELVPSSAWYKNLRNALPEEEWNRLRKEVYAQYGHKCGICSDKAKLNCHEIWEYDDQNYIQKLIGFIALCDMCHHVKHLGLAGILASEGKLDMNEVISHFMKVNDCDRKTFEEHRKEIGLQWSERSKHKWTLELGKYNKLIKQTRLW